MSARIFLTTYHPLIIRKEGRDAAKAHNLPPFVDASCRREPDFEHPIPSISAICHAKGFAPRLQEGDTAVYLTVKGTYLGVKPAHWRLVSILRVIKRCKTHREAAEWYEKQGLYLPSNCLVRGNLPLSLDKTVGRYKHPEHGFIQAEQVEDWDINYQARARKWGTFLACESLFTELYDPPAFGMDEAAAIFNKGRMLSTQTPPEITPTEFTRLKHVCGLL